MLAAIRRRLSATGTSRPGRGFQRGTGHLLDRLAREVKHVIGEAGRPLTDPGYRISVDSTGVRLSPGSFYAGGMLARLEGGAGATVSINAQSDYPLTLSGRFAADDPDWRPHAPPAAGIARRDLVYLEVLERHFTALQDDAVRRTTGFVPGGYLRERALGGPDTCTRLQTLSRAKVIDISGWPETSCADVCGRLQTEKHIGVRRGMKVVVTPVPAVSGPCQAPVDGGYQGAENQMFRVEIYRPGPAGTARFVWSRENGAFTLLVLTAAGTAVLAGTPIVVASLGRDTVTALKRDQWVEIAGEETELGMARNPLAQITQDPVEKADGTFEIRLSQPVVIPTAPFLRRWEQPEAPVNLGSAVLLAEGISIEFDPASAHFHGHDYWTFAARVDTREVDPPAIAQEFQAPRGPRHAIACLSILQWNGATLTHQLDCAREFPPLTALPDACCCTVTVGDGVLTRGDYNNIQDAVDSLPALAPPHGGGVVCILPGMHRLGRPVTINKSHVAIRGCGLSTRIEAPAGAFSISATGVSIERLTLTTSAGALIDFRNARSVKVLRNLFQGSFAPAIILNGEVNECLLEANEFDATQFGLVGIKVQSSGLVIRHNRFVGLGGQAILVTGQLSDVAVEHNQVVAHKRAQPREAGVRLVCSSSSRLRDCGSSATQFRSRQTPR